MKYNNKTPIKQIALQEGVPAYTIAGIVGRYDTQKSAQSLPRSRRPRKLDNHDKRHIFILIKSDSFILLKSVCDRTSLRCYSRTLSQLLRNEGIQHYRAL